MLLFSKEGLIILFFDFSFESGTCNQALLLFISPRGVNSDLILSTRDTAIFRGGSVDYGPKSICWSQWNSFEDGRLEVRFH